MFKNYKNKKIVLFILIIHGIWMDLNKNCVSIEITFKGYIGLSLAEAQYS